MHLFSSRLKSRKTQLYLAAIVFVSSFFSCIPQKEIVLLQDHSSDKNYSNPYSSMKGITDQYMLQPNDYLFINISTPDEKISQFFNQQRSGNMGGGQQNQTFFYYQIDDSMNIDFPYVGHINLEGCNVVKGKERVKEALKPFLKEYNLTFKLATNTFTALGEFRSQGVHNMTKEQITIFEAVAIAGGVTPYGKKKKLQLLRQLPDGPITYTVDLTDKNIVNSEYYFIYPNDMLYVRPMRAKQFGIGESFSIGIITGLLALYITLDSLLK